jgi:hypothetical protein
MLRNGSLGLLGALGWKRLGLLGVLAAGAATAPCPLAAEPLEFSISARTGVHRNENFFRNALNVEEKDLGGLGLTFKIGQQRPRTDFEVEYVPSFQREFDSPHYTAEDHRLSASLTRRLSDRTRLDVDERLLRSDVETDLQTSGTTGSFLVVPRTERFEHGLLVRLDRDLGHRNGLELGLIHELYEYEATRLSDGQVYGALAGYSWRRQDGGRLEAIGRVLRHEQSDRDDTDIGSLGLRYRRPVDRWHEFIVDAGAFQARGPENPTLRGNDETRNGWYGGATYSWTTPRLATSSVSLRRDVVPAPGIGFSTIADLGHLITTFNLGSDVRMDLSGQGARHRRIFAEEEVTESLIGTARLRWEVRPGFELMAGYGRVHQRSDSPALDNLDYNRYMIGSSFLLYRRGPGPERPGTAQVPGTLGR